MQADGVVFTIDDLTNPTVGAPTLAGIADTDTEQGLAYRYALKELSPFAVMGNTVEANEALYMVHNDQGQLDRFNPTDSTGTLTVQYLADRAQFLAEKIALNLKDRETSSGTIRYEDRGQAYVIATEAVFDSDEKLVFESDASEAELLGGSGDDHLYGGGGSDLLEGQDGRDHLEGNEGTDILAGGAGRDILLGQQGFDRPECGAGDDRLSGGLDAGGV